MTHPLGNDFPREGFVQRALEHHFAGWERFSAGHVDLARRNPDTSEQWIIEAKGETSNVGLDFRSGLGQILQAMADPDIHYGLAVPRTRRFRRQCDQVPLRVRKALALNWLLVNSAGDIVIVPPEPAEPTSDP